MSLVLKDLRETENFARDFLSQLKPKTETATILALFGDLGSGKTTFTQFIAKELGIKEQITSPTFVIEKKYKCTLGQSFKYLIHIDCYRLNNKEEMLRLDWSEIIHDPNNLIVVEWSERITEILPKDCVKIEFAFISESERRIEIKN